MNRLMGLVARARARRRWWAGGCSARRLAPSPAAGDVKAAVIPAQSPQAFTLAVPLQVELMTNVAVR
jgi:hypothetical protein